MPDLAPARRFERTMMALEKSHLAETRRALEESRRTLLDALLRLGLSDASLPGVFRREMETLARQDAEIGRARIGPVQAAAADLARSQFEALGRFTPVPSFTAVQTATEAQRRAAAELLAQATWADALAVRLAAETARLRAASEPVEAAADRLFAVANTDRVSIWRAAATNMELQVQLDLGTVGLGLAGIYYLAGQAQSGRTWFKQAVAEIDQNTTDCCLAVHGQVQPLDKPFELTGTPRFADQMMHPRFHWNCRTDELLWSEGLDAIGQSTREMRAEARDQQKA